MQQWGVELAMLLVQSGPKEALVRAVAANASGPVSLMYVWHSICRTTMSAWSR